jgi:predicted DNA-binding protein (UPF0251 family)
MKTVSGIPNFSKFGPKGAMTNKTICMTIEEYETIRLIDYLGYNQQQCADQMNIARTTAQKLYNDARKKIGISLVEGANIIIEGGYFEIRKNGYHNGRGNGNHRGRY